MRYVLLVLIIILMGCMQVHEQPYDPTMDTTKLMLRAQDWSDLGVSVDMHCDTESYNTSEYSPLGQSSVCQYFFDDASVVITANRYITVENAVGTYQYQSSHLRSANTTISENTYGDMSVFYVFREPDYVYHHVWFVKGVHLVHITSNGTDARLVEQLAQTILPRFTQSQ